jgi:hypothetical protein
VSVPRAEPRPHKHVADGDGIGRVPERGVELRDRNIPHQNGTALTGCV